MTKTKKIIFSAIAVFSVIAVLAVCFSIKGAAAVSGEKLTFSVRGQELQGEYIDEINSRGYRHIEFISYVPTDMSDYAVIINVDAPVGENIKVIDDEKTLDKFGCPADGAENDFEVADNEICYFTRSETMSANEDPADSVNHDWGGIRGGRFLSSGKAAHKSSDRSVNYDYDCDNGMTRVTCEMNYYVGV